MVPGPAAQSFWPFSETPKHFSLPAAVAAFASASVSGAALASVAMADETGAISIGGGAEEAGSLPNMAAAAREALNVGTRRNVAVATYEIDGSSGDLTALSGQVSRPGTVGLPTNPTFTPSAGRVVRPYDAEYKILEQLASQAGPNSTGVVNLYSELPTCPACSSVIAQFQKAFPGISINVSTGG